MPWAVIKRDCKQSDGSSGSYVVLKKKGDGSTEQSSCHDTREKAQGSVAARKMSEKMRITKSQLRKIIREAFWDKKPTPPPSGSDKFMKPLTAASEGMREVVSALWGQWDNPPRPDLLKKAQALAKEIDEASKDEK